MIIVQTPLRISLFGGGTDFPAYYLDHGGAVLSSTIDKFIFVTIKQRFDKKLRVGYTRTEMVDSLDEIQHTLIREAFRKTGLTQGIEVTTMGDIPSEGSGLGSSSTVTVGALHAMYAHKRELILSERLAREACEIERDILKSPIGLQDQYIAAYGGVRFIEFRQDGSVCPHAVELDAKTLRRLNDNLLLFFTGKTRKADDILREQKANIHQQLAVLHEMKAIAYQARRELEQGNVDIIGEMLHESWALKRRLASQISNSYLDELYATARRAGAIGGKIAGAGGGGFILLYCKNGTQEDVRHELSHLQELPFRMGQDGSKVIFDYHR